MLRRTALACAMLALPIWLGGCVAAAIPVLAAGGIAAKEIDRERDPTSQDAIAAAVPSAPRTEPAPAAEAAPKAETAAEAPSAVAVAATASASAAGTVVSAGTPGSYDGFIRYAAAQAALDPVTFPRQSALLATAGSLRPITQECGILPPAVIIDLDPAGGKLDPAASIAIDATLAEGLARLRSADVAVFWISAAAAVEAGRVREHLLAAGLDPWGRDGLLLMRRTEDRKELRRRELARTHCVIAIAGDSKSDFDELFDFLRNPAAAAPLDELLGKGWFLAPSLSSATKD